MPTSLRFHFCVRSPKTRDLYDRSFPPETFLALNKGISTNRQSVPETCSQHRLTLISGSFDMAQRCRPLCDFTSACAHQEPENWMTGVQLWTSKNSTVPQGRSDFIFHHLPTSESAHPTSQTCGYSILVMRPLDIHRETTLPCGPSLRKWSENVRFRVVTHLGALCHPTD